MADAKKQHIGLAMFMIVGTISIMYYLIAPSIFYEERTAEVSCPVVKAATVIIKQDDGGETRRRAVEVGCDYSVIGMPRFPEKATFETYLNTMASNQPSITMGDSFVCSATWKQYSPWALVAEGTYNNVKFDLEGCRLYSR